MLRFTVLYYSALLILAVALVGCGGNSLSTQPQNGNLRSVAEDELADTSINLRDVVVAHLESRSDHAGSKDSGAQAVDEWDFHAATRATIGFGVLDVPNVRLRLLSTKGAEIATARSGQAFQSLTISPGTYHVEITNDGAQTQMAYVGFHGCTPWDPRCGSAQAGFLPGLYASVAKSPWPQFHGNAQHTGVGVGQGAIGIPRWTFAAPGWGNNMSFFSSPVIGADGTIYFGAPDHHLYAISSIGQQKWSFATGGSIQTSPAIAPDGTIYVASDALYAVNHDGTQKWTAAFTGPFGMVTGSSPTIGSDGTIYVGSTDGTLCAYHPDGTKKWSVPVGGAYGSAAAIGPDG
jgi:hypothetical protein